MLTKRNLKRLANASIGNKRDWESESTAKAFKKGLNLAAKDMEIGR